MSVEAQMATINLDGVIEGPRVIAQRKPHRVISEPIDGGALVEKKAKRRSKPRSRSHSERLKPYHEIIKDLSIAHPYDKFVDDYALKTGRPASILKHHLQDKYRDHLVSKMPDGTPVLKRNPVTGKITHPATGMRQPTFSHVDMVRNYLSGKPSSLDSDKYVVMNGKVVPKSNGNSAIMPVDNGYTLIPREFYQRTVQPFPGGPRLMDVNRKPMYAIGTNGPVSMLDQRLEQYDRDINTFMNRQLQANAERFNLNVDIVNEILASSVESYSLNKSHFKSYETLLDMLTQSRGDIILDTPFSPTLISWMILTNTINKYSNRSFIDIDYARSAERILTRLTSIPANIRIVAGPLNNYPTYSAYFLDGTLYDRSRVYWMLTKVWPLNVSRSSKKIVIASRHRLGDDLKSFYKIMGFDIFKEIFGQITDTDADLMEQYNEVIRGYSLSIKIRPGDAPIVEEGVGEQAAPAPVVLNVAQAEAALAAARQVEQDAAAQAEALHNEGAEDDVLQAAMDRAVAAREAVARAEAAHAAAEQAAAAAPPAHEEAAPQPEEAPPPPEEEDVALDPDEVERRYEEQVLNVPIYIMEDYSRQNASYKTAKYKQTKPADLVVGNLVIAVNADYEPAELDGETVVFIVNQNYGNDRYTVYGLETDFPINDGEYYLRKVTIQGYRSNVGNLAWASTRLKYLVLDNSRIKERLTKLYNELVLTKDNPLPDGITVEKFIDIYRRYIEGARERINILTIPNNNYEAARAEAIRLGVGRGLMFSKKSKAHIHLLKYGGVEIENIRNFNPTDVKFLMSTTFINGFPVYLTEFSS